MDNNSKTIGLPDVTQRNSASCDPNPHMQCCLTGSTQYSNAVLLTQIGQVGPRPPRRIVKTMHATRTALATLYA
jgi:hypothetical protein